MMRQMSCVFCKQEVGVPIDVIDIKNQTVLAVCDNCYLRGGRLPGLEWEVSIDGKGKVRQPKKRALFGPNNTPAEFVGYLIGWTCIGMLFYYQSIGFGVILLLAGVVLIAAKGKGIRCKQIRGWWKKIWT